MPAGCYQSLPKRMNSFITEEETWRGGGLSFPGCVPLGMDWCHSGMFWKGCLEQCRWWARFVGLSSPSSEYEVVGFLLCQEHALEVQIQAMMGSTFLSAFLPYSAWWQLGSLFCARTQHLRSLSPWSWSIISDHNLSSSMVSPRTSFEDVGYRIQNVAERLWGPTTCYRPLSGEAAEKRLPWVSWGWNWSIWIDGAFPVIFPLRLP